MMNQAFYRRKFVTTHAAVWVGLSLFAQLVTAQEDSAFIAYGDITPPAATINTVVQPRTIELIDAALESDIDTARRVQLTSDLGLCPVPASEAILKRLLTDPDPLIRAAAVQSLRLLGLGTETILSPVLKDTSPLVRFELVNAKLPAAIIAGVSDDDASVRATALATSINEATDRAIADQIDKLPSPMQAVAVRTLGDRKEAAKSVAPKIAPLLASDNIVSRIAAIDALTGIGVIEFVQIQTQLAHPHSAVRVATTHAAKVLSATDQIVVAKAALSDKDLSVRTAGALLAIESDQSFTETLVAQLSQNYQPLRLAARDALVRLGKTNDAAKPLVLTASEKLLTDATPDRRIDGSYILGQLRSKQGLADHIKLLEDSDWRVVEQAARSLGQIGDPSAGDKLVETALRSIEVKSTGQPDMDLISTQYRAGEQAVLSATAIKHKPVLAATKKFYLQKLTPGGVRNASIYALGLLGQPDQVVTDLRPLLGRIADPEESPASISEAIKAMGNAKAKTAIQPLKQLAGREGASEYLYIIHLALNRINETNTPYTPDPVTFEPHTSIRALGDNR